MNYFRGHRFRGRVVVEYGEPIMISKALEQTYRQSRRAGYQGLLTQVEDGMRSVIVTAASYEDLKLIHTARRLYQRSSTRTTTKEKQDLSRRFAAAYRVLRDRYESEFPEELKTIQDRLEEYQDALDTWGLRDYQVTNLDIPYASLFYSFFHGAIVMLLASIPSLILNAPVGFAARYWSKKEAKKDLKASRVKLAARDVLLSKKILFSFVAVPSLWVFYAVLLWIFTPLEKRTIIVLLLCCPIFSYMGVMAVEAGMTDVKDLRPAFLKLLPGFKKEGLRIATMRTDLQKEVRRLVKKYGPELGPIYYEKSASWEVNVRKSASVSRLVDMTSETPSKAEKNE